MHLPDFNEEKNRTKTSINYIYIDDNIKQEVNDKKYFLRTYGCQMNVHDSEAFAHILEKMGYSKTEVLEEADVVLLNTCGVRENVHDKVIGYLGRCKHLKKSKPDLKIVIAGCMAQQRDFVEELMNEHKYVDLIMGTHNIHELVRLLNSPDKQIIEVLSNSDEVVEGIGYNRDSKISAWVNIMLGCDKFCTYCIVPYTRGRERSRKLEEIVKEVKCLKDNGYMEVTLLGQNVNAYGKDIGEKFSDLLEQVALTGIPRVRFVTSHPWNFTDEMIDVIAKYDNIMPYIHLPLQSGSNNILKKMNRRYTKEEYLELFNEAPSSIESVTMKLPRPGKDSHFGMFDVTFAHDYYEVPFHAK